LQSQKKVLVAESNEVILVLISHILTRQSYLVETSVDALEADLMLQRESYDALIVDAKVPNGGLDLIRRIAERDVAFLRKTVLLTTTIADSDPVAHLPLGAIVKKPFEISDLVELVRTVSTEQLASGN
jgi:DNA-binding response OmpR family regulator